MELISVAPGVLAWMHPDPGPGRANAGVVIDEDGLTIVDALLSPAEARPLFDAASALGHPIRRLVLTSSHLAHVGGSGVFALPAVYGSPQISAHMDQPPNLDGCCQLYPDEAQAVSEIAEVPTRPVTHTVAEGAWLSPAAVAAPLPGELAENLVVQVPAARVVFAGALASFGVTPMAGTGDPAAWADALDTVAEWGDIIVPGHGPIGGVEELRDLQAYLRACVAAEGDPTRLADGPWADWSGRHYDAVNVQRAAMLAAGDDAPPPALLTLLGMQ